MHLVFHIFQGMGISAAVGIRPFLPALVVGALAAGDVVIDFNGTGYHFLETAPFLLVLVVGVVVLALLERRSPGLLSGRSPLALAVLAVALVLGALEFAGALAQGHDAAWPGFLCGVACAAVGILATRPLLARVRARLDEAAAGALPLYAETSAVLIAALSAIAPPVGLLALVLLLWLLLASRKRAEQKYAGLRILR